MEMVPTFTPKSDQHDNTQWPWGSAANLHDLIEEIRRDPPLARALSEHKQNYCWVLDPVKNPWNALPTQLTLAQVPP